MALEIGKIQKKEEERTRAGTTLRSLATRLTNQTDPKVPLGNAVERPTDELESRLVALARSEYDSRRKRAEFISGDMLGEPAWDILLDLFIQTSSARKVSIKSACKASASPDTTALRWLAILESRGLVERQASSGDKRVHFVRLSETGNLAVSAWLRYRSSLPV
jgi:hypothetical protein